VLIYTVSFFLKDRPLSILTEHIQTFAFSEVIKYLGVSILMDSAPLFEISPGVQMPIQIYIHDIEDLSEEPQKELSDCHYTFSQQRN
jgi:hypothetical protein